jgi:hypothetical protein
MTITARFGRKLKVPSTFQIKHQIPALVAERSIGKKERRKLAPNPNVPYTIGSHCDEVKVHATSAAMRAGVESG